MVPFENRTKMSGFRMVTWPFENRPSKCPDFEWIRFSNGRISDPHCIWIMNEYSRRLNIEHVRIANVPKMLCCMVRFLNGGDCFVAIFYFKWSLQTQWGSKTDIWTLETSEKQTFTSLALRFPVMIKPLSEIQTC